MMSKKYSQIRNVLWTDHKEIDHDDDWLNSKKYPVQVKVKAPDDPSIKLSLIAYDYFEIFFVKLFAKEIEHKYQLG